MSLWGGEAVSRTRRPPLPQEGPWYSSQLETAQTSGSQCACKVQVN
jgi:hypothetical protein